MTRDFEPEIFDHMSRFVEAEFGEIQVVSQLANLPASFPSVYIGEFDSKSGRQNLSCIDNFANVTYEVKTYSKKRSGSKREAKAIANAIRAEMSRLGFRCAYFKSGASVRDSSVYEVKAAYVALLGDGFKIR